MYRGMIIIAFLLFSSSLVNSQESKFRIGIGLKPIITSIVEPDLGYDPIFGLSPSIILDYRLTDNILIGAGLEYERKGGTSEVFFNDIMGNIIDATTSAFNLNFLQIPLLITYRTKGKVKFYANTGLNLGYLFDQNVTYESPRIPDSSTDFDPFELSFLLGAGIEIECNDRFDLGLGLRNNFGLIGIQSDNNNQSIKTNTLGFMANLSYNL